MTADQVCVVYAPAYTGTYCPLIFVDWLPWLIGCLGCHYTVMKIITLNWILLLGLRVF